MPDGKTHATATTMTAATFGPAFVFLFNQPVEIAVAFTSGCLVGLLVSPDLDVNRGNRSYAVVRNSIGCLGVWLWQVFWMPYTRLVPHRSPVSHTPILGTALRVTYMAMLPALIWWSMGHFLALPSLNLPNPTILWAWAFAGLAVVDTLHVVMDSL